MEPDTLFTQHLWARLEELAKTLSTEEAEAFIRSLYAENDIDKAIEGYHRLLKAETLSHLEDQLLQEVPREDFVSLHLPIHTIPQIHRPLPRSDDKNTNGVDQIHKHFLDKKSLKKHYIDKAILSLYEDVVFSQEASVVLFTWVMTDGLGDYSAQYEAAKLLHQKYPSLTIHLITLLPKEVNLSFEILELPIHKIFYTDDKDLHFSHFPEKIWPILSSADLILQIPTQYLHWEELKQELKRKSPKNSLPRCEILGEYGFIDTKWYHPGTEARCMGLHFLEKGIFIKQSPSLDTLYKIENKHLLQKIFQADELSAKKWEEYSHSHQLYLAYLITEQGYYLYLHALIKYLETNPKNIDICFNKIDLLLLCIGNRFQHENNTFPLFEKYHIKDIEIHFQDKVWLVSISSSGKSLRFFHFKDLHPLDFQKLLWLSGDIMACRGDQSFSEAVSADKLFFYDMPMHARPFLKDVLALAKKRISEYPSAIECLSLFFDPYQEKAGPPSTLEETAEHLGSLLQDKNTFLGIKKLNSIIREEYPVNFFLLHLVARALFHEEHPEIEEREERLMQNFIEGKLPFAQLMQKMSKILQPYT